jgi:hypothetical protein
LAVFLAGAPSPAVSATAGIVAVSDAEAVLLRDNPALAEVADKAPEQLRDVLDRLASALANPSGARGGLEQLDPDDVLLLETNPALLQAWRSSPEASADLLALIRVAAGGGKPRK